MADNEKAMDKYGHAWRVGDMSLCLTALVSLMSGMGGWIWGCPFTNCWGSRAVSS